MPREGVWLVVLAALVACAPTSTPDDADASPDRDGGIACGTPARDILEACGFLPNVGTECSPDGEGWCCPFTRPASCGCGPSGGFALSPCDCSGHQLCDLAPSGWGNTTDEHGCPTLEVLPTTDCCVCGPDAGVVPMDAP